MIPFLRWLLHGEDFVRRLALVACAGSCYVVGSGWRPEDPVWWAAGLGAMLAAGASRPGNGGAPRAPLTPGPGRT